MMFMTKWPKRQKKKSVPNKRVCLNNHATVTCIPVTRAQWEDNSSGFFSEGHTVMINYVTQYLGLLGIAWKLSPTNKTKLKSTSVWDFPLPEASLQTSAAPLLLSTAGISGLCSSHIEKTVSGLQFALTVLAGSVWNLHKGEEGPCWLWEILVYRKPDCNLAAKKTLQRLLELGSIQTWHGQRKTESRNLAYWRSSLSHIT